MTRPHLYAGTWPASISQLAVFIIVTAVDLARGAHRRDEATVGDPVLFDGVGPPPF